ATLDRVEELSPLAEKRCRHWLAGRRADVAYHLGDVATAAAEAAKAEDYFHVKMAERLAAGAAPRRVQVPVSFVRQHHMTCAPATLAAVSRYWSMPADHLGVAEAICYDGTTDHGERRWAEENGWIARDFKVTWESAAALIDRGVPFTLTTVEPSGGHLQAVVGYDPALRVLLVRDPFYRHLGEFLAEETFERYRATGPRGMALVPRREAARLEGLDLPEAELHDGLYELQDALSRHDRERALRALERMEAAAPSHRLALLARRALAVYDCDGPAIFAANQKLLDMFPEAPTAQLLYLPSLRELGRREERIAFLTRICDSKGASPIFLLELAKELLPDAREHARTWRLLRRAIRLDPRRAESLHVLGDLLWRQGKWAGALDAYRFAACLEDKIERYAESYFSASRHLKRTDAALRLLEDRFQRFGRRSSWPARTLFWALERLDLTERAFAVLDRAIELRPGDGDLLLYAADAWARNGDFERSGLLLAGAEGKCSRSEWLQAAARLAQYQGGLRKALDLWRQVVEAEPLNAGAHRATARLLAETESPAAAVDHLRAFVSRFPHNCPLHELLLEWLGRDDPAAAEDVARRLIEVDPSNAWARRERALLLGRLQRIDEALEEMEIARRLEPWNSYTYSVLGDLHLRAGSPARAREALRAAIRLSGDNTFAISSLVGACATVAERREALELILAELRRQTLFGDGLLAFRDAAAGVLSPEELLACLREAHEARPDLWHSGASLARQLCDMGRLDEALEAARRTAERFPLVAGSWLDLARVRSLRGEEAQEVDGLEHALQVSPGWSLPARRLADVHGRAGDLEKARSILERAASRDPLDARNHGCLADALWKLGRKEEAVARLERSLRLDPAYDWAWGALEGWAAELGRPKAPLELARELAAARSGEALSWLNLARRLAGQEAAAEALEALEKAVSLDPRCEEAHDLRAARLAEEGLFEEARAACRPAGWDGQLPTILRGRAAWVEAERGNRAEAIRQMRAAVADNPDYGWGLRRLAEWCEAEGDLQGCLDASRRLVEIAPEDASSHGYLGDAQRQAGDRAAAKTSLRRAVELDPSYLFAGQWLFELELEDCRQDAAEIKAAGGTLKAIAPHLKPPDRLPREARLAAASGERGAARSAFEALSREANAPDRALASAAEALEAAGWGRDVLEALGEAVASEGASPAAAALWARRLVSRGPVEAAASEVGDVLGRGKLGEAAAAAFIDALVEERAKGHFWIFFRRHKEALAASTELWGWTGYGLSSVRHPRGAVKWLSSWREREGVEPWMLQNLACALRDLGRDEEAREVSLHALTLAADGTTHVHELWLALDEAFADDVGAARERLARIDRKALQPYHQFLARLAEVLLEAAPSGGERRTDHRRLRREWLEARKLCLGWERAPALYRACWRAGLKLGWARRSPMGLLQAAASLLECPLLMDPTRWVRRWLRRRG
ncbi:MAG: tetratricopeptide repeat protein, partial [Planctomycetes bacterium]|nr:tetratricopeptide repeat protein [Planctomycetota bacterium]